MTISLLVTGSRDLSDVEHVTSRIARLCPDIVFVGDCPTGVDLITREWCRTHRVECRVLTADWAKLGKSAGPMRNSSLVRKAKEVGAFVLAFPRGGSGTRDCIAKAKRAGLHVTEA